MRVGVDANLAGSINHLLNQHESGKAWCELHGPRKIDPRRAGNTVLHQEGADEGEKLTFSMQDDGGESIDRY